MLLQKLIYKFSLESIGMYFIRLSKYLKTMDWESMLIMATFKELSLSYILVTPALEYIFIVSKAQTSF